MEHTLSSNQMRRPRLWGGSRQAFTLIEMLVVVTIIVLLLAFSTPALMSTMQASRLSSAGDTIFGAISEAQQTAFAQNVPVELRFFKYNDAFNANPSFRSYQLFKVTLTATGIGAGATLSETLVPAGNLTKIPEGTVLVSSDVHSPIFQGNGLPDTKGSGSGSGGSVGYSGVQDATYNAIRFMTDGSCRSVGASAAGFATLTYQTLPNSFFTITYDIGKEITPANLPKNFFTIQIDPFTGKARNYKPGF